MKRRIYSLLLIVVLVFFMSCQVSAALYDYHLSLQLNFNGTTANCKATIFDPGKYIDATITLWYANTAVASWPAIGTSSVSIDETVGVVSGRTYRLAVTGTIGGVDIVCTPITKTCP